MSNLRLRADGGLEHPGGSVHTAQGAEEIKHVKRQDDISVGQHVTGRISGIEAMRIGEIKTPAAVDDGHG
jgi:hypothetical protein